MTDTCIKEAAARYPGMILPPYDEIFGILGYEPLVEFTERFGGCQVYVPRMRHIFKDCLTNALLCEFDGCNYAYLAVKYGFCEKFVREIVKKYGSRSHHQPKNRLN